MIALLEAHRAGLYARHQWLSNVIAGVIVGGVALHRREDGVRHRVARGVTAPRA
ncbi:hypothetical protein MOJ79_10240 [Calidifontimicrobium sp. SYSU G02091]|uniref:hypothetical protein n=1 Tax=Calidifontimicrobium sp. SYSU G02091 TaxID=2926421 RepID=UPI001F5323F9|nr:hypothetical protein [Calidifontimicrobium sp. SYSU G02091]MCI1192220.1 hypothetical protein [Calidifontimicrobium sp. SYSU G02091]